MTPQEVANCTFAKAVMGGYNMAAVDDFLDKLTEDYSALYKENAALKSKMKVLVDKMEEYRELEDAMRSTLLTAQKMANNMVAEAEAKRDALIADSAGAAKARLAEIEQEVAQEEQRLVQVHNDVDAQIAAEQKRLAVAQEELRSFIQSVQNVCQGQLRLPDLPAAPAEEPAPAKAPPAEQPAAASDAQADRQEEVAGEIDSALEKDLEDVFAAFSQSGEDAKDAEPQEEADPFAGPDGDEDSSATRVLNLDDLQFGRNYTRE